MADIKRYPKMIQKEGEEHKVVYNAYEHMHYFKQGWSGPPEFGQDIESLKKEIEQIELELLEKKERLADMEATQVAEKEAAEALAENEHKQQQQGGNNNKKQR